jgi:hypothetical protein
MQKLIPRGDACLVTALCGGAGCCTNNRDLVTCEQCIGAELRAHDRDPVTASKDGYTVELEQAVREDLARQGVPGAHDSEQVRIVSEPHATDGEPWTELECMVWSSTFGSYMCVCEQTPDSGAIAAERAHEAVRQLRKLGAPPGRP